jgi:hypothetical protein
LQERGIRSLNIVDSDEIPRGPLALDSLPSAFADYRYSHIPADALGTRELFFQSVNSGDRERARRWVREWHTVQPLSWSDAVGLVFLICRSDQIPYEDSLFFELCDLLGAVSDCRREDFRRNLIARKKRLLFPSPGRCGGNSIARALTIDTIVPLRTGHEAHGQEFYDLFRKYKRTGRKEPLVLLLDSLCAQYDALGGNPYGLLLPFFRELPFYDVDLLWVHRDPDEIVRSILDHNFHYEPFDFIRDRITAVDYGEMAPAQWQELSRAKKVKWYIDVTLTSIEEAAGSFQNVVKCSMGELSAGLRQVLEARGMKYYPAVRKCNAVPYYRPFTPEELVVIFHNFKQEEIERLSPDEIEALLRREMGKEVYAELYPAFKFQPVRD